VKILEGQHKYDRNQRMCTAYLAKTGRGHYIASAPETLTLDHWPYALNVYRVLQVSPPLRRHKNTDGNYPTIH
jgi:hypothetical protein